MLDTARPVAVVVQPLAASHGLDDRGRSVLLHQREQRGVIEARGVRVLERTPVPLLPVPDEIRVERAGPAHPALEEGEVQLRETARDAAEEEGFRRGLAGRGEGTRVVVAEVR